VHAVPRKPGPWRPRSLVVGERAGRQPHRLVPSLDPRPPRHRDHAGVSWWQRDRNPDRLAPRLVDRLAPPLRYVLPGAALLLSRPRPGADPRPDRNHAQVVPEPVRLRHLHQHPRIQSPVHPGRHQSRHPAGGDRRPCIAGRVHPLDPQPGDYHDGRRLRPGGPGEGPACPNRDLVRRAQRAPPGRRQLHDRHQSHRRRADPGRDRLQLPGHRLPPVRRVGQKRLPACAGGIRRDHPGRAGREPHRGRDLCGDRPTGEAGRMTIDTTTLTQAPATFQRARILRLPRSPKVIVGLVILGVFSVVAVIGRWITPYSPNATDTQNWVQHILVPDTGPGTGFPANYYPLPLPPSAAHWLGTTVFAQDTWSQLLASTQATMFVGLLAATIATVLSIAFGVTAGYIGGPTDEGLSLIANVSLAIPGLPLLIVLADYVPSAGSSLVLVASIIAVTTWAYSARTLREGFANNAGGGGWWWWWATPGICVALLGTGLALVNFGIDEFINPKLRTSGLTARAARRAGVHVSTTLGLTPVMRRAELAA